MWCLAVQETRLSYGEGSSLPFGNDGVREEQVGWTRHSDDRGGVEALARLAGDLPPDLPAAVFVVVHFPEGAPSVLPRAGALGR